MSSSSLFLVLLCLLISSAESQSTFSCSTVETDIAPCLPYLTSSGPLTAACCTGASTLDSQVSGNTAALQSACNCVKTLADSISGFSYGNAQNIPEQCGINLPFTVSPDVNCNSL